MAGKTSGVVVHELLAVSTGGEPEWLTAFNEGVLAYVEAKFELAKTKFEEAVEKRGGTDGPSEFYLKTLSHLDFEKVRENWTGLVELAEK